MHGSDRRETWPKRVSDDSHCFSFVDAVKVFPAKSSDRKIKLLMIEKGNDAIRKTHSPQLEKIIREELAPGRATRLCVSGELSNLVVYASSISSM